MINLLWAKYVVVLIIAKTEDYYCISRSLAYSNKLFINKTFLYLGNVKIVSF